VLGTQCRACRSGDGDVVLDLGSQPACDYFPARDEPGPDPVYPLRLWLCSSCGLAQLMDDPTGPEEPRGTEPAALVEQAADAVVRVAAAGWLGPGARVVEYGSPHGGSWLGLLAGRGASVAADDGPADVVLDCFGMMHRADQAAAMAERSDRVAPGGILLLQYHSLATILRLGQWNSLRHGHYAYYSATALAGMLAGVGFSMRSAWHFDLYGGTVLVVAARDDDPAPAADSSVRSLIADEQRLEVRDPERVRGLQMIAERSAQAVHDWLVARHAAGTVTVGYGAASRAVALLCRAGIDCTLLPAVADASPAKHGRRMPGTDVPVVSPQAMVAARPESVLLFLSDLMNEVQRSIPQIEAAGGRWVDVDTLTSVTRPM
jgi:C-methyltransferase C-terminal domain/Putative zinc binding domain/Methyltransferase domain